MFVATVATNSLFMLSVGHWKKGPCNKVICVHVFSLTLGAIMHYSLNMRTWAFLSSKTSQQPYLREGPVESRLSHRLSIGTAILEYTSLYLNTHRWQDQPEPADIPGDPQSELPPLILLTTMKRKLLQLFILGVLMTLQRTEVKQQI